MNNVNFVASLMVCTYSFVDGMYLNDFKQLLQIFFIFLLIEIAINTLLHCVYLNEPYCILNFFHKEWLS